MARDAAAQAPAPDLVFEDFSVGDRIAGAELTVTAEDAAFFAETFGPGAAEPGAAGLERVPVSGFHVAALGMRLLFDAVIRRTASLGAPGVDRVTWPNPVRVGDRLTFTAAVEAARPSASRPAMGLVTVAIALFNQHGACVMTQENAIMVARRDTTLRRDAADRDETEIRA